jgi:hypothetical protein
MADEARCRSCGTKILWIEIDGKRIPLDARQHPIYTESAAADGEWYREYNARLSHFVTCPNASKHSRSNR